MHKEKKFEYTWEEAIEILRNDSTHEDLIYNSYLTSNLMENCQRFEKSKEFLEVLNLIKQYNPTSKTILDMPGGNGIATYGFSLHGFDVTTVEPDSSNSLGRGAIQKVLTEANLKASIVDAWGEDLPFKDNTFDIVYVRQGLHHADNLNKMLLEISRVLSPEGVLIAAREHVVDNYEESLNLFLASQIDHQLYGGENAFTLTDYRSSIKKAKLKIESELKPFDSIINYFPSNFEDLEDKVLSSSIGQVFKLFLPKSLVVKIAKNYLNTKKNPGRLYTFIAKKI